MRFGYYTVDKSCLSNKEALVTIWQHSVGNCNLLIAFSLQQNILPKLYEIRLSKFTFLQSQFSFLSCNIP